MSKINRFPEKFSISMTPEQKEELKTLAEKRHLELAVYIRVVLTEHLNSQTK